MTSQAKLKITASTVQIGAENDSPPNLSGLQSCHHFSLTTRLTDIAIGFTKLHYIYAGWSPNKLDGAHIITGA